jgi:hypothetical protein
LIQVNQTGMGLHTLLTLSTKIQLRRPQYRSASWRTIVFADAPSFEARHPVLISSFRPGCRFDGENPIFDAHVMNQPPLHP